eukprot:scaffold111358_cov60-Phaeocystis_antarctica.AAC.2
MRKTASGVETTDEWDARGRKTSTHYAIPTLDGNLAVPTVLWNPSPNCPGRVPQARQPYGPGTAEVARKGPASIAWVQGVAQAKSSESLRLGNFDSSSSCNG